VTGVEAAFYGFLGALGAGVAIAFFRMVTALFGEEKS